MILHICSAPGGNSYVPANSSISTTFCWRSGGPWASPVRILPEENRWSGFTEPRVLGLNQGVGLDVAKVEKPTEHILCWWWLQHNSQSFATAAHISHVEDGLCTGIWLPQALLGAFELLSRDLEVLTEEGALCPAVLLLSFAWHGLRRKGSF